jgi:hypothetical protein
MNNLISLDGEELVEANIAHLLESAGYATRDRAYDAAVDVLAAPILLGSRPSVARLEEIYTDAVRNKLGGFDGTTSIDDGNLEQQVLGTVGIGLSGEIAGPLNAPRRVAHAGLTDPPSWAADQLPTSELPTEAAPRIHTLVDAVAATEGPADPSTPDTPGVDPSPGVLTGFASHSTERDKTIEQLTPWYDPMISEATTESELREAARASLEAGHTPFELLNILKTIVEALPGADAGDVYDNLDGDTELSDVLGVYINECYNKITAEELYPEDIQRIIEEEADRVD